MRKRVPGVVGLVKFNTDHLIRRGQRCVTELGEGSPCWVGGWPWDSADFIESSEAGAWTVISRQYDAVMLYQWENLVGGVSERRFARSNVGTIALARGNNQ